MSSSSEVQTVKSSVPNGIVTQQESLATAEYVRHWQYQNLLFTLSTPLNSRFSTVGNVFNYFRDAVDLTLRSFDDAGTTATPTAIEKELLKFLIADLESQSMFTVSVTVKHTGLEEGSSSGKLTTVFYRKDMR